jgi:hypothetical protein
LAKDARTTYPGAGLGCLYDYRTLNGQIDELSRQRA